MKEVRGLKPKMNDKFKIEFEHTTEQQQFNVYKGDLTITPRFDNLVKFVKIEITAEANRRLITICGKAFDSQDKKLNKDALTFQDTFENFIALNIEEEIIKILEKYFLKE